MTNTSETGEAVWVKAYSNEAAKLMNGGRDDYLTQIKNARTIFVEIEIDIKSGDLYVLALGIGGMIERPWRSVEPTFPVGDYRVKRATVEAWWKSRSTPQAPPAIPALSDAERRLTLLRSLGGDAKYVNGAWTFTGIAALAAHEKGEGRKRCDVKTIRTDLKAAARDERDAKASGSYDQLVQRK